MKLPLLIYIGLNVATATAYSTNSKYDELLLQLREQYAALETKVSELEYHRNLQQQCGFVLNNGACELSSPLEVDSLSVSGTLDTVGLSIPMFGGNVDVTGTLSTAGVLKATGEITIEESLTVSGATELDGGIDVQGSTVTSGFVQSLNINSGDTIIESDLSLGDDSSFSGDAEIKGTLHSRDLSSDASLSVSGTSTFEDDLTVTGDEDYLVSTQRDSAILITIEGETSGTELLIESDLTVKDMYVEQNCFGCDE